MFDPELSEVLEPEAIEAIDEIVGRYFAVRVMGQRWIMRFREDVMRWHRELGRVGGKFRMWVEFERYAELSGDDPWLMLYRHRLADDVKDLLCDGEFKPINVIEAERYFASLTRSDKSTKLADQVRASLEHKASIDAAKAQLAEAERIRADAVESLAALFVQAVASLTVGRPLGHDPGATHAGR